MAKRITRQELVDYCLRQLGAPVLEINVDDDQTDDESMMLFSILTRDTLMVLKECI